MSITGPRPAMQQNEFAASEAYPHLFSPIELAGHTLKNRIVHAAISTKFAAAGRVTQQLIDYHVNRARGGAAMIVTEPLNTLRRHALPTRPTVFGGVDAAGLACWATAVAEQGSWLVGQLQDPGRGRHEAGRSNNAIGATALPDDLSWTVPHVLTTGEVEAIIEEWTQSARVLKEAGFAGIEISAGHGHLFHQFLSAWSNRRDDKFGQNLEGRTRLVTDLIRSIRAECGPDFIVGAKLPAADDTPSGIDLELAAQITEIVYRRSPPDYLTYCWGSHADDLYWHVPDLHGPRAPYVEQIHQLGSRAPGIPIGALGLITDPNEGEHAIATGLADLVILGRPLITDPAWGIKALEGREAQIRYCVSCNTCWHMITAGQPLQCDNNPRVGAPDEADWRPSPAPRRKRVVVVGSGIAGMEAAWVAAGRGHDVTVFGASAQVGGKTRLHAWLPGGENLSSIYDYQHLSADRFGARLELGVLAGIEDVLALEPEVVVLATGSTPRWPDFLPAEYEGEGFFPNLREAVQSLLAFRQRQPGRAVIFDQDHGAFVYAAAEFLLDRFEGVTLVTQRERIASDEPLVNRQGIYRRLYSKGVDVVTLAQIEPTSRFEEAEVTCRNIYSGGETVVDNIALLTYATPRVPNDHLAAPLRAAGVDVRLIGDCFSPRSVLAATAEGYRCGEAL